MYFNQANLTWMETRALKVADCFCVEQVLHKTLYIRRKENFCDMKLKKHMVMTAGNLDNICDVA